MAATTASSLSPLRSITRFRRGAGAVASMVEDIPPPPPLPGSSWEIAGQTTHRVELAVGTDVVRGMEQLNMFAAVGEAKAAQNVFGAIRGIVPEAKQTMLWNTVLKAYSKAGDFDGALAWYAEMTSNGIRANAKTFGKLLESAANAGHVRGAEAWLVKLYPPSRQSANEVSRIPDLRSAVPSFLFAHAMPVAASARAGEVERAAAWFQRVRSAGLAVGEGAYCAMIHALAERGDVPAAAQVFKESQAESSALGISWKSPCSAFIRACGQASAWSRALQMLTDGSNFTARGVNGSTMDKVSYTALADAFAKRGDVSGAAHWLHEMQSAQCLPNVISYNTVIDACARSGDAAQAAVWFGNMLKMGITPNDFTYNTLISSCARRRNFSEAAEWLNQMHSVHLSPDIVSYNAVIDAHAKSGDTKGAKHWLDNMTSACISPDQISYTAIVDSCAKRGDVDEAALWLEAMADANVPAQVSTYNAVIAGCASNGNIGGALDWFKTIGNMRLEPDIISHNSVLSSYAKGVNPSGALSWLDTMANARHVPNTISYNIVVDAFARIGDADMVANVLDRMTAQGLTPNVVTWTSMLAACANAVPRRAEAAERVFRRMLQCGIVPNRITLRALGRAVGSMRRKELLQETAVRTSVKDGVEAPPGTSRLDCTREAKLPSCAYPSARSPLLDPNIITRFS